VLGRTGEKGDQRFRGQCDRSEKRDRGNESNNDGKGAARISESLAATRCSEQPEVSSETVPENGLVCHNSFVARGAPNKSLEPTLLSRAF
jgi:hypothetical protein